jgi:AcrR family transcriptional regulator
LLNQSVDLTGNCWFTDQVKPPNPAAVTSRSVRSDRASGTRDAILTAAEQLFAEHGVFAVSNRQVSEAAGQGNNAAVGYHFGTKADLIRAIVRKHNEPVERLCQEMVERVDAAQLRDWVDCLVRPLAMHLGALGNPTWYARFSAQLMPDPAHRDIASEESLTSQAVLRIIEGLTSCLPDMPTEVHIERNAMARHLIVHMFAERERALAAGDPTAHEDWEQMADSLVDAITGLMLAPVTTRGSK